MFVHNINPVLLEIGVFQIRYYSLAYILGFLFAYFFLRYKARKGLIKGFTEDRLDAFMIYLIIGVIAGARIFTFIFYYPDVLLSNPLEVFMVWQGGMSFHGGLIGAIIAVYFFSRKYKMKFYFLADLLALPALFFLALGRIANFINGELWGTVTNLPWGVKFPHSAPHGTPIEDIPARHPYQLYAAAKDFFLVLVLWLATKGKKLKEGLLFWWFVFLYNSTRFLLDFVREEQRFLGISTGQYLSLAFTIISIYFLYKLYSSGKRKSI